MIHDLIIYTDIGDDIDDSLALWYIHQQKKVRNLIVVLYSYELHKRQRAWQLIEPFFEQKPIIIEGGDTDMIRYFLQTRNKDMPLDVMCIGPTTDFACHLTTIKKYKKDIRQVYFQARMRYQDGLLIADSDSFNYKEDKESTEVILQTGIPTTWIGKYVAYQLGLDTKHFKKWQKNDVGKILYKEGLYRREYFAAVNPMKCQQVYGHCPDIISFPYDLIAAIAMYYPEHFIRIQQGNNICCGHDERHCLQSEKNILYSHVDSIFG